MLATDLHGTVSDSSGSPLPYATLYINNTTNGTTTNQEGYYQFDLMPGTYQIAFQYVGFKKIIKTVTIGTFDVRLDVVLENEVLQLDEVIISAEKEDPAYRVIRNAINKRKFHQQEVQAYKCDVYIKGMQTLKSRPDKIFGYTVPVDTGIVYLSESISQLSFERPNKIKEVMISSKVSGNITNFSYNQGSQMLISFYDNLIKAVGLSERSFVSPIASNALFFYHYKLEGVIREDSLLINKIKVIPKRKNDPVFEGYLYIIENSWKIHSTDLVLTRAHQIEFMNRMRLQQVHAPVQDDIWMMISQTFSFELDAFGFKGEGNFTGIHSNYEIEPNVELISDSKQATSAERAPSKKLFPKKYFTSEILSIETHANKKDNIYWNRIRPIPLTDTEMADYQKNDSLKTVHDSRAYKDSLDKRINKISLANVAYSGYTYQKSFEEKYFYFSPLIRTVQFNTVEGAVVNLRVNHRKYHDNVLKYRVIPQIRYGFSSAKLYGQLRGDVYWNPQKFSKAWTSFGQFVSQINETAPITIPVNTFETLVRGNNFMKLYEKTFFTLGYQSELKNGFLISSWLEYADRRPLENSSDFSFFDNSDFTSNDPENQELADTRFERHQALRFYLKIRIDLKQKYISRPDGKIIFDTDFPRLEIYYRKGIPAFGSDIDYDQVIGLIAGGIPLGLVGQSQYTVSAGAFLRKNKVFFPDYIHFNTNQSIIGRFSTYRYNLLDYYLFSTTSRYYSAHFRHHFNGFVINKLPLIRKSKVQVVGSVSYLNTVTSGNYFEYGVGIEHIFKIARIDYYVSTLEGNFYAKGFRVGIGF